MSRGPEPTASPDWKAMQKEGEEVLEIRDLHAAIDGKEI